MYVVHIIWRIWHADERWWWMSWIKVQWTSNKSWTEVRWTSDRSPMKVQWKSDKPRTKVRWTSNESSTKVRCTLDARRTHVGRKFDVLSSESRTKIQWTSNENQMKVQWMSDENPTMTTQRTTLRTPQDSRAHVRFVVMADATRQPRWHYGACMSSTATLWSVHELHDDVVGHAWTPTATLWGMHELHGDGGRQHDECHVGRCCEACVNSAVLTGNNMTNVMLQLATLQLTTLQLTTNTML